MTNNSIYSSFIEAKTGELIPALKNGKTLESRYNPKNDALKKLNTIDSSKSFFIVIGIASGIFINELLKRNPLAKIICIEQNQEDINFLMQSSLIKQISQNSNIIFCNQNNIVETLINNYIPAFYGNIQIIENQIWCLENRDSHQIIQALLNKSLEYISKDFSVQSHFGKLWQSNIINNIKLLNTFNIENTISIPLEKEAVIVAAGPSLDKKISYLKNNNDKFFIISTDTAYSTLLKNNVFGDCVVSIDAQQISYNHFINENKSSKDTLFVFDLTGNHSACKKLLETNHKLLFTINNHPLSNFINSFSNNIFPSIFTGAGTVTIGAVDLAVKLGFKKIQVYGADFSYINNKPYTKGTYLDSLYFLSNNIINSAEKAFSSLMFRTEIKKSWENRIQTWVLASYEASFNDYLNSINADYKKEDDIYKIEILNNKNHLSIKKQNSINLDELYSKFKNENCNFNEKKQINNLKNTDICLLPLISWLRNNDNIKEDNFSDLLKIAYSIILRLE